MSRRLPAQPKGNRSQPLRRASKLEALQTLNGTGRIAPERRYLRICAEANRPTTNELGVQIHRGTRLWACCFPPQALANRTEGHLAKLEKGDYEPGPTPSWLIGPSARGSPKKCQNRQVPYLASAP